jgi:hypothetical protein
MGPTQRAGLTLGAVVLAAAILAVLGATVVPPLLTALEFLGAVLGVTVALMAPWLLVALAAYGVYRWVGGRMLLPSPPAAGPSAAPPIGTPSIEGLAPDLQDRVERIRESGRQLVASPQPLSSSDRALVEQIEGDYLPATLRAYASLPVAAPEREAALPLLLDQLQLIERTLDGVRERAGRQAVEGPQTNQRFLEQRFRDQDGGDLNLPG